MAVTTFGQVLSDILLYLLSPSFCYEEGTFKNNVAGLTMTDVVTLGLLVKKSGNYWVPVLATDEANAGGIIVSKKTVTLAENATTKVTVLVRGPAIIAKAGLPTKDVASTNYTQATIVTALAALKVPIIAKDAPGETTTPAL